MKAAESKTTTASQPLQAKAEAQQPFFQAQNEQQGAFFGQETPAAKPFFTPFIQTKLSIGQPGDKYEQEADAMAEQVVQRLASRKTEAPIQRKCAECAAEEEGIAPKLQLKSIFESNEEPAGEQVQRKCAACTAEKIQPMRIQRMGEEEEPELQAKGAVPGLQASADLESRLNSTKGGGSPLSDETRTAMESSFGTDFSGVRVHTNSGAVQMNQELGAQAFTHGSDVYFNSGKYNPGSTEGNRLLGHELTHVVQQGGGVAIQKDPPDAGAEPLPGGVAPTPQELEDSRLYETAPSLLQDTDIGPAIEVAQRRGNQSRVDSLIDELNHRPDPHFTFGVGLPPVIPRGVSGNALVTPEIAFAMFENMMAGRPPFRPELGVGGASWFVTEGNPHTGVAGDHNVPVQVEIINTRGGLLFEQADLDRIYAEEEAAARSEVEAQVREQFRVRTGRDAPPRLSQTLLDRVARQLRGLAEQRMWTRVGQQVAASPAKVGEVILRAGGRFSANPGRFTVVADAARIRIRGGLRALLDIIRASPRAEPVPALGATEELARTLRAAGRVRSVFRFAGKIFLVVAITATVVEIITAEDTLEAVITSAVGWAGAIGGAAAFSALWTPVDVAGPWAWAAHGVGALVAGGIGFWVGSEVTRYVYRLTIRERAQITN